MDGTNLGIITLLPVISFLIFDRLLEVLFMFLNLFAGIPDHKKYRDQHDDDN